jgi:DNA-binding protein YbaB
MKDTAQFEGSGGDGAVKIRLSQSGNVIGVTVAEFLLAPKDKEMLEGLIAAAVEDAVGQMIRGRA